MASEQLTASAYLAHPDYGSRGPLTSDLSRDEKKAPPSGRSIQQALIGKNTLYPNTFAPGEYEHLVAILAKEYPLSFNAWLDGIVCSLSSWIDKGYPLNDESTYPLAVQSYLTHYASQHGLNIHFTFIPYP